MNLAVTLLAQAEVVRLVDNRRHSYSYEPWSWADAATPALLVFGLLLGVWALFRLAKWRDRVGNDDHPRSPFGALVRAHGLSRSERSLCLKVATELGLTDPAELFVRPEVARTALAKFDAGLSRRLFC